MKKLTMENGQILLDGKTIPGLKEFNIASSSNNKNIAELTIRMDVFIDSEAQTDEIDKFVEYFINS